MNDDNNEEYVCNNTTKHLAKCKDIFSKKTTDYGTAWRILRTSSLTDQIFHQSESDSNHSGKWIKQSRRGNRARVYWDYQLLHHGNNSTGIRMVMIEWNWKLKKLLITIANSAQAARIINGGQEP